MQDRKEHINVIYPEAGKRYRLNVRTPVSRLTIGKVKQCLAAASSCPIPLPDMVLHLNGVPLSSDEDMCESLGIGNGATLSVEARTAAPQTPLKELNNNNNNNSAAAAAVIKTQGTSPTPQLHLSEQRRLLELQTLEQQDAMLHKDGSIRDDILKSTLQHVDSEMDQVSLRRRQLERQRETTEEELKRMHEKETAAAKERERLAALRAQEALRATERAALLAERREELRAEHEAARAVALLKLENEKKKATLAQQQARLAAERERALLEQSSFEAATKARELELRSREIDMEHQRLARIREARALDADRRAAVMQRLHYYDQLGVEPPRALQREAALLMGEKEGTDGERDGGRASRITAGVKGEAEGEERRNGLVQSRGPSSAAVAAPSSPAPSASHPRVVHPSAPASAATAAVSAEQTTNGSGAAAAAMMMMVPEGGFYDARENAEANLRRLGDDLGVPEPLRFDDSDTCVISIDGEYTLLVTYDAATERLYVYSTLLATLPPCVQQSAEGRMRLYEFLLEASLLGREMCGGGVGASLRNGFVLMSASLYMPTSQPWALRTLTPQFLHCLQHWRTRLSEFLKALEQQQQQQSVLRGSPGQSQPQPHTYSVSPPRSAVHVSPSPMLSPSQQQQQQQQHSPSNGRARVVPVLGLEVTGTVLVNGIPTHYDNGVLVVNAAGPSVLAGIQPNDFVEEMNGVPIRSVADFRRVVQEQLVPGMMVPVRINRGGVAMIVTVRVEAAWSL